MSPDQVDDCAEYLSKRCESKSLVVKSKALRAIRTFCVRAPATFRQKMARHSVVVRACASHTGAPHPLRGDAPHKQVRDLADEAVRAIFDGGDSFSKSVSQPSPNADPPGERSAAGVPIVGDAPIGHNKDPRLRKTTGTWGGEERREGFGLRGAYASEARAPSEKKDDQKIIHSSVAAGTGIGGDASGAFAQTSTAANTFLATADASPGDTNASLQSDASLQSQEGSEEQRRVDAACARGGVKPAPSAEVLAAFTRQCEGLRPEGVAAALAAKFAAANFSHGSLGTAEASERRAEAFKAACCLEACARSEGGGARRVAGLFRRGFPGNDAADALRALAEGGESGDALAEKAKAAAVAVDAGDAASTSLQSQKGTTVSAAAETIPGPATSSTSSVDFFGLEGLATGAVTGASVPPVPVPALVPVPAAAPAVDDLLGGLSLGGDPARTTQRQQTTQPQTLTQPRMLTQQQVLTQPQVLTQQQMLTQQQHYAQQQMLMQHQHYAQQQMMVSHAQSAMSPTPLRPPNVSAASPTGTSSAREKTNAARAPAALVGGPSAYAQRKEAGAFDFVSDLLGSEKKK